jgi:hypothetical protein
MESDVEDWWDDDEEPSDEDYYSGGDEDEDNFDLELRETEADRRHNRKETIKSFKYFSRCFDRVLKGRLDTPADIRNARMIKNWNSFSEFAPTTVDDDVLFLLRRRGLAEFSIFGLALPSDDMVFEAKQGRRRSHLQLFNCLFRIDYFTTEHVEDFRSFVIEERLEEISRKKAARKANRKRHHKRGKGKSKQDKKKGSIDNSISKSVTQAGSPSQDGSNSLGLSSFEDRNSSQSTSQVSFTLDNQSTYMIFNTCDEGHPSVTSRNRNTIATLVFCNAKYTFRTLLL